MGLTYMGCRICGETHNGIKPQLVIAVLDSAMREPTEQVQNTFKVNWLQSKRMFDYDHVEIGSASEDDIKTFCIEIGNDADPARIRKNNQMQCIIQPGANLSGEIKNILQQHFKKVIEQPVI